MNCFRWISLSIVLLVVALFTGCRKKHVSVTEEIPPGVQTHIMLPVIRQINEAFGGYYAAVPPDYFNTSDNYPLLLFLHGLGQMGNGSTELHYITFDGIGKVINENRFPVSFSVNGQEHSFIVVSPQSSRTPSVDEVKQLIDHICKEYRADKQRIYLSGLSMGARVATLVAAEYPTMFAAMAPIAGVADNQGVEERCRHIAEANLPVWEFHNSDDPMADVNTARRFIDYISGFNPAVLPRFTVFDAYGHDAWTTALDPKYKEDGMNVYEWMLRYER